MSVVFKGTSYSIGMAVCKEIDIYSEPIIVGITDIRKGPVVAGCLADISFNPHASSYEVHKIHTD